MKMETYTKPNTLILLDCDLISHFIANQKLSVLSDILSPHQCVVLDYVYTEVACNKVRLGFLDAEIKRGTIVSMSFPNSDIDIKQEFAKIKKDNPLIGDGERACMAVAKHQKDIIASSNFRDVAKYCNINTIKHLGTLDILIIAHKRNIFTEQECDDFIKNAIAINKAKFPSGVTAIRFYHVPDLSWFI